MHRGSSLREDAAAIAAEVVTRQLLRTPRALLWREPDAARAAREEADRHIEFLASAASLDDAPLFLQYAAWAKVVFLRRHLDVDDLLVQLEILAEVLDERLVDPERARALTMIRLALARLPEVVCDLASEIDRSSRGELARAYLDLTLRGQRHAAVQLVLDAAERGVPVRDLYLEVFQPVQREIGRRWQLNEISVAQEHLVTAATQLAMAQLYPRIFSTPRLGRTAVVSSVAGDLHELGARMVADFLEMHGWDCIYLGASTPTADIVPTLRRTHASLLGISASRCTNLDAAIALVEAVRDDEACAQVKIVAGGSPFNARPDLWRTIGADAGALDAGLIAATVDALFAGGPS